MIRLNHQPLMQTGHYDDPLLLLLLNQTFKGVQTVFHRDMRQALSAI